MEVVIQDKSYKVNIIKKPIKNMYLRVKPDLEIYVTANFLIDNKTIINFIQSNKDAIVKMIKRQEKKKLKEENFYLLGKCYDVIICPSFKKPEFVDDKIYIKDRKELIKIHKEIATKIFNERLKICYNLFDNIPYPELKIRKMKSKWGYCNKKEKLITLNLELIKYGLDEIDYVIIHELCHFIYFNHSKDFWNLVSKYKPNYKENRKVLKEE